MIALVNHYFMVLSLVPSRRCFNVLATSGGFPRRNRTELELGHSRRSKLGIEIIRDNSFAILYNYYKFLFQPLLFTC